LAELMYDGGAVYGVRAMGAIVSKRVNVRALDKMVAEAEPILRIPVDPI
jgi:hypothetical protein